MTDKQEQALVVLTKVASTMSKKAEEESFWNKLQKGLGSTWDASKEWLANPENQKTLALYAGTGLLGGLGGAALGRKNPLRNGVLGALLAMGGLRAYQVLPKAYRAAQWKAQDAANQKAYDQMVKDNPGYEQAQYIDGTK